MGDTLWGRHESYTNGNSEEDYLPVRAGKNSARDVRAFWILPGGDLSGQAAVSRARDGRAADAQVWKKNAFHAGAESSFNKACGGATRCDFGAVGDPDGSSVSDIDDGFVAPRAGAVI